MRVLKIATSDAFAGDTPDELRTEAVSDLLMEAVTGEPFETVVKSHMPSPSLPGAVERWLDRHNPDIVFIFPNLFFVNYESTPVKLQRKFGRASKPIVGLGLAAGGNQWLNRRRWFRTARRGVKRLLGGEPYFEPEAAVACYEAVAAKVLQREGVSLAIGLPASAGQPDWMDEGRADARYRVLHRGLSELCAKAHAPYYGYERPARTHDLERYLDPDGLHGASRAKTLSAVTHSYPLVEAWRSMHPGQPLRTTIDDLLAAWRVPGAGPVVFDIDEPELERMHGLLASGVIENVPGAIAGPPWVTQAGYARALDTVRSPESATPA